MFKHILIATDGSTLADRAVSLGLNLARLDNARVTVLTVVPDYTMLEYTEAFAHDELAGIRSRLVRDGQQRIDAILKRHEAKDGHVEGVAAVGDRPYEKIIETADRLNCDLIVMASRGRGAVGAALLGSQTSHVLALSKVHVLVAKHAA